MGKVLGRFGRAALVFLFLFSAAAAQQTPAKRTVAPAGANAVERYLDSIRDNPSLLLDFVRRLPKGADLHIHITGTVYAESLIDFAVRDNICIDTRTMTAVPRDVQPEAAPPAADGKPAPPRSPCDETKNHVPAARALADVVLYRQLIDAWSMRDFVPTEGESGHDHFFDTFNKFSVAKNGHNGDMIAEIVSRAAHDRVSYVEIMVGPNSGAAARLGVGMGWSGDMAAQRQKLLDKQIERVVADGRIAIDQAEARMREILRCGSLNADPGCKVTVRYLYQVPRGIPRDQVFAEMVAGFETVTADPRVVGVNPVMAEDWPIPMRDFSLHMRMFAFLKGVYPKVHLSLHAGELAPQLVPPEGLRYHVRESVEVAHAERIGHGTSVMYERDPIGLLKEMADKQVLVEICLTSNDVILGTRGAAHPLAMYLKYGVPVALGTDDLGVSRSDNTQEFLKALLTYRFRYATLKTMARNSLEHAFVAGESYWADARKFRPVAQCEGGATAKPSATCRQFLDANLRALLQAQLEREFSEFEAHPYAETSIHQ
jgi:adenosine deaminase